MLKIKLLHPDILHALAVNGHGAKILLADGNFPLATQTPAAAKKVFLNLAPGLLSVTDVLGILKDYIPIESVSIMVPPDETEQPVHADFRTILAGDAELKKLKRLAFYQEANSSDTCLAIATGETRRFANILLTIGVLRP